MPIVADFRSFLLALIGTGYVSSERGTVLTLTLIDTDRISPGHFRNLLDTLPGPHDDVQQPEFGAHPWTLWSGCGAWASGNTRLPSARTIEGKGRKIWKEAEAHQASASRSLGEDCAGRDADGDCPVVQCLAYDDQSAGVVRNGESATNAYIRR
jgi:hypothetical protein